MVHCFKCQEALPLDCKCKISDETKYRHWLDLASREIELCKAIIYNDFKPEVQVGEVKLPVDQITMKRNGIILCWDSIRPPDWRKARSFVLLDIHNKPLFRFTRSYWKLIINRNDSFSFSWFLKAS